MQNDQNQRSAAVIRTPGCIAFWDFVKREPVGERRFAAHVPGGATYADFPLLGRGPFGQAIQMKP
jgi:hypothetical protein